MLRRASGKIGRFSLRTKRTIKRHIKEMDNVYYVGRGFSGHGEITVRSNVRR